MMRAPPKSHKRESRPLPGTASQIENTQPHQDSAPDLDLQLLVARRLVLRYAVTLPVALILTRGAGLGGGA